MQPVPSVIEGVRARLRRSLPTDARAVYLAAADPGVMRFMDWPAHRAQSDAQAYLDGCAARWESGAEHHWIIEEKVSGAVLGCIACRINGHSADFGYFLARSAWGKGLATEAGGLLVGWLKRQSSILRIWATTDEENTKSGAVLERLGLQKEGLLRMATYRPNIGGVPRNAVIYGYVKNDA
jgi:[ribosomal protein S5]-alanine N-acetyltransferase